MPDRPDDPRFETSKSGAGGRSRRSGSDDADRTALASTVSGTRARRGTPKSKRAPIGAGVVIALIVAGGAVFAFAFRDRLNLSSRRVVSNLESVAPNDNGVPDQPLVVHEGQLPPPLDDMTAAPASRMESPVTAMAVAAGAMPGAMPKAPPEKPDAAGEPGKPNFYRSRPKGERRLLEPLPKERPAVPDVPEGGWRPANAIDQFIRARMAEAGVKPKPLCSDWDFARRASLDLVGFVPTQHDLERYFDWTSGQRRKLWVDFLLEQPQYADRWTIVWGDLLRERDRIQGAPNGTFKKYIHRNLIANRPYDEWVREMLTASGPADENPATAFILRNNADPTLLTISAAQVFLGVQLRCAQCHNHPFDWWLQDDFDNMTLFWEGTRLRNVKRSSEQRIRQVTSTADGGAGTFLTGQTSKQGRGREALADLITRRDNPYFARVAVNRLWETLLGTGLVNPSDTFSALNPPSHPALLDWLAIGFIEHKYDLKHILRLIANSRTYQQSSVEKKRRRSDDEEAEDDTSLFVGMPLRPMSAEQIHDSILAATGRYAAPNGRYKPSIRIAYPPPARSFLRTFGSTDRETLLPRSTRGSIQRSLNLLNDAFLNEAVKLHPGHPIRYWQARSGFSASQIVDALYAQILTRRPTRKEREWALKYVAAANQPWAWEDLQWALFNTREFQFIR